MSDYLDFLRSPKLRRGILWFSIALLGTQLLLLPEQLRSDSRMPYGGLLVALTLLTNILVQPPDPTIKWRAGRLWALGFSFALSVCTLLYVCSAFFSAPR